MFKMLWNLHIVDSHNIMGLLDQINCMFSHSMQGWINFVKCL